MANPYIDAVNSLMQQQQTGQPAADPTDVAEARRQKMEAMLNIMSGDPALTNLGRTTLDQSQLDTTNSRLANQSQYERGQNQISNNLAMGRLAQGDQEQSMNRQLRRDKLDELTREFQERQAAREAANNPTANDFDPDTLDMAATTVMTDPSQMRQYATFGKTGQAHRDQINARISQKLGEAGMSPADLGGLRANFKAQGGSIQKMVPQLNAIQSYEDTAKFNGQRILDLIDKVDNTGVPFIEGYTRRAKVAAGDPDAAELANVLNSYQTESARILNNPNMTGVISDSARKDMQTALAGNASAAQYKRLINRLNTEMDFRKNAIQNQISGSTDAMRNLSGATGIPGAAGGQAPPPTGGAPQSAPQAAEHWVIGADGKPQMVTQ